MYYSKAVRGINNRSFFLLLYMMLSSAVHVLSVVLAIRFKIVMKS